MSKVFDFLNECGVFFVSTVNKGRPATRPFGAVMEYDGKLFFSTGKSKEVYHQLKENSAVQIVALKAGTREWIRIDGYVAEETDCRIKEKMFKKIPQLKNRFSAPDDKEFAVFSMDQIETMYM